MKITMDGKYTCNGQPVRIICVDGPGDRPVVGFVGPLPYVSYWTADGTHCTEHGCNLCLIPAKPEPVVEWGVIQGGKFFPVKPPFGQTEEQTARRVAQDFDNPLAKRTLEIIEP